MLIYSIKKNLYTASNEFNFFLLHHIYDSAFFLSILPTESFISLYMCPSSSTSSFTMSFFFLFHSPYSFFSLTLVLFFWFDFRTFPLYYSLFTNKIYCFLFFIFVRFSLFRFPSLLVLYLQFFIRPIPQTSLISSPNFIWPNLL